MWNQELKEAILIKKDMHKAVCGNSTEENQSERETNICLD